MITEQDKARARGHLGYPETNEAFIFALGVPASYPFTFITEAAYNRILPSAEARFVQLLDRMDAIEQQIEDNTENVEVTRVDEIEINEKALEAAIKRYKYWQGKLANILAVPPYPFDQRPWFGASSGGINVAVNQ